MAKKIKRLLGDQTHIDCACLIHDKLYGWEYVDRLYNSLCRNLTPQVRMHVYTESNRSVPDHMIHHKLLEWPGIRGAKSSWWYKVQLFNPQHHSGPLLYFDLDTVIVNNLDWIWKLDNEHFWAPKDFKYLFNGKRITINSSVMWFRPEHFQNVWNDFDPEKVRSVRRWYGDQDYINEKIPVDRKHFIDPTRIRSWKWQVHDGGMNWKTRKPNNPGTGTILDNDTAILVFHGNPKPHDVNDHVIQEHWR